MNQNINEVVMDFAFFSGFDMLKSKRLINQAEFLENAVVAGAYGFVVKEPAKQLRRFIPQMGLEDSTDMIIKFAAEAATAFAYRWVQGKERNLGPILLKQLLAQGSQEVFKQF